MTGIQNEWFSSTFQFLGRWEFIVIMTNTLRKNQNLTNFLWNLKKKNPHKLLKCIIAFSLLNIKIEFEWISGWLCAFFVPALILTKYLKIKNRFMF